MAQCSQHPDGIFGKAEVRLRDHANALRLEVLDSVDVVENGKCFEVVEEAVDSQVPAPGIFLGSSIGVVSEDDSAFGADNPLG